MPSYPRLSFVVATPETKGSTGFASGLVSQINAHTAKNAHARKRIAKDQTKKVADAHRARSRHLVTASYCEYEGVPNGTSEDYEAVGIGSVDQLHQSDSTNSSQSDTTVDLCGISDMVFSTPTQLELFCLDASLKSMVCLPLAFSTKEIRLIQFYLTYGRRMQLGTSEMPRYDPSIDVMQRLIETSPLYSLVHIVISQHLLSGIMRESMPLDSYKYQAEAYRTMNRRINDSMTPVADKIFDLIQLTMLEFSLGRKEQSILHLEALESFVQNHGEMRIFLDPVDQSTLSIEPRFYMGMFLRVYIPIRNLTNLQRMLQQMLEYYERIRSWLVLQNECRSNPDDTSNIDPSHDSAKLALRPLRTYLEAFGRKESTIAASKRVAPAYAQAYICSWMILVTLVEHNICGYDAVALLQEIQAYMEGSCEDGQNTENPLSSLFVGTVINTISYVRRNTFPSRSLEELSVCQAGITALRCYWLADAHWKKILARKLCVCVFSSIESCSEDMLAPSFVSDLHDVVMDTWLDND